MHSVYDPEHLNDNLALLHSAPQDPSVVASLFGRARDEAADGESSPRQSSQPEPEPEPEPEPGPEPAEEAEPPELDAWLAKIALSQILSPISKALILVCLPAIGFNLAYAL